MGWCSEFGVEIASCDHPMVAGADACHCDICGALCEGRFDGCPDVWARGPVQVDFVRHPSIHVSTRPSGNGASPEERDGEVRQSVQSLERRLDALEATLLEKLGEEIRNTLDTREEARTERLDEALERLLQAVVALDVSAHRPSGEAARAPQLRRRQPSGNG